MAGYQESAGAAGAWAVRLTPAAPVPVAAVRDMLAGIAEDCPLTAYLHMPASRAEWLVLGRDPSRAHGTPDIEICDRAAARAATTAGWAPRPNVAGVMAALGLREGYDPTARTWSAGTVRRALSGPAWVVPTLLISVRAVDGGLRWWEEPAALITAPDAGLVPALDTLATRMRQERYTVTDFTAQRTAARTAVP